MNKNSNHNALLGFISVSIAVMRAFVFIVLSVFRSSFSQVNYLVFKYFELCFLSTMGVHGNIYSAASNKNLKYRIPQK